MISDISRDLSNSMIAVILLVIVVTLILSVIACIQSAYEPDNMELITLKRQRVLAKRQQMWRFYKSLTLVVGVLAFIASVFGIEKLVDDIWRPMVINQYTSNVQRLRQVVRENQSRDCALLPQGEACKSAVALNVFMESFLSGNKYDDGQIRARLIATLDSKATNEMANLFSRISAQSDILSQPGLFGPEAKLLLQVVLSVLVGFALAISFAEHLFSVRMDGNKVKDIDFNIAKKTQELPNRKCSGEPSADSNADVGAEITLEQKDQNFIA